MGRGLLQLPWLGGEVVIKGPGSFTTDASPGNWSQQSPEGDSQNPADGDAGPSHQRGQGPRWGGKGQREEQGDFCGISGWEPTCLQLAREPLPSCSPPWAEGLGGWWVRLG